MTQPTFSPVPASGTVRPTMATATPEFSRFKKSGLLRSPTLVAGQGVGTQAPGEGYALLLAHREVAKLSLPHEHDRHDLVVGIALVAAKRASLVGRGPQLGDVRVAMNLFGLALEIPVEHQQVHRFAGLAHSYFAQRRFVDAVSPEDLLGSSGAPIH